jgi:iron complex outermembrane receptor protein
MSKSTIAAALCAATALGPNSAPAQSAPSGPGGTNANHQSVGEVAEVVVTAQRREERLTDVPIAISSQTGAQLTAAGINTAQGLSLVVPGLNYATQGAFAQPTIRGIGTSLTGPGADANVALYIDGVYQPNQTGNILDLNNIANVEVLKGPQGTLFGRNATGGAILVTTLDPSPTPVAILGISYGRFNEVKANAYVNAALSDSIYGNLALYLRRDDGYVKNVTDNHEISQADTKAVRGKLSFRPTDNFSVLFSANYTDASDNSTYGNKPLNGDTSSARALAAAGLAIPSGPYDVALNGDPTIRTISYGGAITTKYASSIGTFTSISSIEKVRSDLNVDIDNTPILASALQIIGPDLTATQEFDFASKNTGPLNWIAGAYYYYDLSSVDVAAETGSFSNVIARVKAATSTTAWSIFAEGNYKITDQLKLTLGGRFSSERKIGKGYFDSIELLDAKRQWTSFTPRAVLSYKINSNNNVYFSFSEGFKSGNFNVAAFSPVPVSPETIDAYELGFKHAAGPLTVNLSTYYYDYKNLQIQIQQNVNNVATLLWKNAAAATIYGFDADLTARLNTYVRVRGGLAYTHAVYDNYDNAIESRPAFVTVNGVTYSNGNTETAVNASGQALIRAPVFTANFTPSFEYPLPIGRLVANMTVAYNSGFDWEVGNYWRQPAYTILNANVGWVSSDDRYRVSIWGTNLTNTKYYIYENPTLTGTGHDIARPWSAGASMEVTFK